MSRPIREVAQVMAWELERQQLRVVLVPYDRNRCFRAVEEQNPEWYQKFCADYPSQRSRPRRRSKPDTAIKRNHTIRGLNELASGICKSEYARRLLDVVKNEYRRYMKWE